MLIKLKKIQCFFITVTLKRLKILPKNFNPRVTKYKAVKNIKYQRLQVKPFKRKIKSISV